MILVRQDDWQPGAGRHLAWIPTHETFTAAAASGPDGGTASFLQRDHIAAYAARPQDAGPYNAWTAVATRLDGTLERDAMTRAFTTFIGRHDGLCTFFPQATPTRHHVDPAHIAFAVEEQQTFASSDEARDAIIAQFQVQLQPRHWPGFVFGAIEHDDSFTLYWGADHAFTDGASQSFVLAEIADLYDTERGVAAPAPHLSAGFREYVDAESARAAQVGPDHPAVEVWGRLFDAWGGGVPRFPLDLGLAPGETAPVRTIPFPLLDDPREIAAFDAAAKAAGGRASSAVIAAVAATDRALAGHTSYAGATVLATRHYGDFATTQGWCCTFAPVMFEVGDATSVAELVPRAAAGFNAARAAAEVPAHAAIMHLVQSGRIRPDAVGSPNLLSYLDLRHVPGAGRQADERAEHFTGEGRTSNASMWINRDAHTLYVGMQSPDTPQAQHIVNVYLAHLRDTVREFACI